MDNIDNMDNMDNISTDIDFDAIEKKHQINLLLYQENGAVKVQPDPPILHDLIPLSNKHVYKGDYNCDILEDMGWTDEFDKYSNEPDPCGKSFNKLKNTYIKKPTWKSNPSEESYEDIAPWGDLYSDDEIIYDNSEKNSSVFEKIEEIEVSTDKIAADVLEVSRDMSELIPIVTDTNEDVRNIQIDISKINKRFDNFEDSLASLHLKMDGVNHFLKIIADHFNE